MEPRQSTQDYLPTQTEPGPRPPSVENVLQRKSKKVEQHKSFIYRIHQIIWYIFWIVEAILITRIVLKLLGANAASSFVTFVYDFSRPLVQPFLMMFEDTVIEKTVFEWSAIIASIIYAIITYFIVRMIKLAKPTNIDEVEATIDY